MKINEDVERIVLFPCNEHSAPAVRKYMQELKILQDIFPLKSDGTFERETHRDGNVLYSTVFAVEDVAGKVLASNGHDCEGLTTTEFLLEALYNDPNFDFGNTDGQYRDPRPFLEDLRKNNGLYILGNGKRIRISLLDDNFPVTVAKYVILAPTELDLRTLRNDGIKFITEKRLKSLGAAVSKTLFPRNGITPVEVTRGVEYAARFDYDNITNGVPVLAGDLYQTGQSATKQSLVIIPDGDFGVQPLVHISGQYI